MPESPFNPSIEILYIEDDPGDARLTREIMETAKLLVNLTIVESGALAMAYLEKEEPFQDAPRPDLILLDLNLPDINGRDLLARIKSKDRFKAIPVVVLTTSDAEEDILKSYRLGASCYVKKPVGLDAFSEMITHMENFWFTIVKYPPKSIADKGV